MNERWISLDSSLDERRLTRRSFAGLPAPLVQKYYSDIKTVLAQKEVQDALVHQGITVINSTPEQAAPFFRSELDKHARLVKQSGATAD